MGRKESNQTNKQTKRVYYLALQELQSYCYLILISQSKETRVNSMGEITLWNYFWSMTFGP